MTLCWVLAANPASCPVNQDESGARPLEIKRRIKVSEMTMTS